ncbi:MAG: peptide chain release factor-like protein [Candidatus Omnitrophota bacterium]
MPSIMKAKDIKIEVFKSSGPGGQHKNKRFTAVRLTHVPTGLKFIAQKRRSLAANKALALERLEHRLEELSRPTIQRRATRRTAASKNRTLDWKKKHGRKKQMRSRQTQGREDF